MTLSLDTETTGVDIRYGAKPYFITLCDESLENTFYEWDVNPLTRQPNLSMQDADEIYSLIEKADTLVFQNCKFDITALEVSEIYPDVKRFPWHKVEDTLIAGHLLASNQEHDLTTLADQYIGLDILPLEKEIHKCVEECRRLCRSVKNPSLNKWRIAKHGMSEMPSAKKSSNTQDEKLWKADMWLPRAIAKELNYPKSHPYWTVLREYANADSLSTLLIWGEQKKELYRLGLWDIYKFKMKMPSILHGMEKRGVTLSKDRLESLSSEYKIESERLGRICVGIAESKGFELKLPSSAAPNQSLRDFCFGIPLNRKELWKGFDRSRSLDLPVGDRSKKTGMPSLDKKYLEHALVSLPPGSKQLAFIRSLISKRSRDTAISYMNGYKRYWKPLNGVESNFYLLHPNLNLTGTATTRKSSKNPNEQNISKKEEFNLRYAFGPSENREWWSIDYENLEQKIPAYEGNIRPMIELFEKPDDAPFFGSYHLFNASIVYPDLFWPVSEEKGLFRKKYPYEYTCIKNGGF